LPLANLFLEFDIKKTKRYVLLVQATYKSNGEQGSYARIMKNKLSGGSLHKQHKTFCSY
jgi:hypothetical protein